MLHPDLFLAPVEIWRARLMLATCLLAGGTGALLIIYSFLQQTEQVLAYTLVAMGHLFACSTIVLLRHFPTLAWPATAITLIGVTHLLSAAYVTGGMESSILYVFPMATVFLGLIGGVRHGLFSALFLSAAAVLMWWLNEAGISSPVGMEPASVKVSVLLWSILTAAGVVYYTQRQTDLLLNLAQQRVEDLTLAQTEAEDANQAKDLFMAYLSHEIRNPLAVIIGAIELMAMKGAEHRREAHLSKLQSASQGLTSLLQDVLDYASLERGQLKVEESTVPLSEMVAQLHRDFLRAAEKKGLDLLCETPTETIIVQGDPGRVRQVLGNLIENAIKFTDRGEVTLRVVAIGHEARVVVEDTGPGIPLAQQAHICQPFIRGSDGKEKGVGLGLAISSGLLDQMGSRLVLDSQPGKNTFFCFNLPIVETKKHAAQPEATTVQSHEVDVHRVLVVDDNHAAAHLLAEMCRAIGCAEVKVCHDGSDAINTVNHWQPNVVFLDLEMPMMNGRDVAHAIHREQTQSRPRVVLVTGSVIGNDASFTDLPVSSILSKPVHAEELRNLLVPSANSQTAPTVTRSQDSA